MLSKIEIRALKEIWNYMCLDMKVSKSDVIIGHGCKDLDIPVRCAQLYQQGLASKIIFSGGLGKLTQDLFQKTEAETYQEIAIKNGVKEEDILLEKKSTNTGENIQFSLELIQKENLKADKIILVSKKMNERRNYNVAKKLISHKQLTITSPTRTIEDLIEKLNQEEEQERKNDIAVIVGDVQRVMIYPQFGWQIEDKITPEALEAYTILKNLGYNKFIYTKEQIQKLINQYGIIEGQHANYFN